MRCSASGQPVVRTLFASRRRASAVALLVAFGAAFVRFGLPAGPLQPTVLPSVGIAPVVGGCLTLCWSVPAIETGEKVFDRVLFACRTGSNRPRVQTRRPASNHQQPAADRSRQPDRTSSDSGGEGLFDRFGIPRPKSWGLLCLRLSLAATLFWGGFTKLWPGSPETAIVAESAPFLPQPEFVVFVGFLEALIGLLLLYRPLLRIATLLVFVHTLGTQTILLFNRTGVPEAGIPGAWLVFPFVPSGLGLYVLKNYVVLTAAIVVAIGYTGSQLPRPPLGRLRSATVRQLSVLCYRLISDWLPRHALTFLRSTLVFALVGSGLLTIAGYGMPLGTVETALATLDVQLTEATLASVLGGIQLWAGILLLSDNQGHLELAVLLTAASVAVGLSPMLLVPEAAFYRDYVGLSPSFESLYFLRDLVLFGGVWTIRDAKVPWQPARGLYLVQDAIEVLLAWLGIGARNAPQSRESEELRRYRGK